MLPFCHMTSLLYICYTHLFNTNPDFYFILNGFILFVSHDFTTRHIVLQQVVSSYNLGDENGYFGFLIPVLW